MTETEVCKAVADLCDSLDPPGPKTETRLGFRMHTGRSRYRKTWTGRLVLQFEMVDRFIARPRLAPGMAPTLRERGPYWTDARTVDFSPAHLAEITTEANGL